MNRDTKMHFIRFLTQHGVLYISVFLNWNINSQTTMEFFRFSCLLGIFALSLFYLVLLHLIFLRIFNGWDN